MRSVYSLCSVLALGLIIQVVVAASLSLDRPLPFLGGHTIAQAFLVWWLYVAPPFTLAALALLIWKSWMESLSRNARLGGWIAVITTVAINLFMALEILSGSLL